MGLGAARPRQVPGAHLPVAVEASAPAPAVPGAGVWPAGRLAASLLRLAGGLPPAAVSTCTTSRLCRSTSGCTLTERYALSSLTDVTCPIGIPGGYSESAWLETV